MITRRLDTGRPKPRLIALARRAGWLLFRLLFRLEVHGQEQVPRTGPVLLAVNHSSALDGPLVFATCPRPVAFLVKAELYVGPMVRLFGWFQQIPVRRGRPDRQALREGLAVLAAGGVLGICPEGTRGSGQFDAIRPGVAYFALHSGCPVVPVVCRGTTAALPRGTRRARWRAPVQVVFGAPFTVSAPGDVRSRQTLAAATEEIHRHLVTLLQSLPPSLPPPGPRQLA